MIADAVGLPVSFFIQYHGMEGAAFRQESQSWWDGVVGLFRARSRGLMLVYLPLRLVVIKSEQMIRVLIVCDFGVGV